MTEQEHPPYFQAKGDEFAPAPHARSYWAESMLHGRLLGALMARAINIDADIEVDVPGTPGLRVARLTVDLFRNAPLAPVRVETERVRDGRRIRVVEARSVVGGEVVAKASAVLLRHTEQPGGTVPSTPPWDAPPPEALPPSRSRWPPRVWRFTEGDDEVRHWSALGNRRIWLRETCLLVADEPLAPLVRAALAADSASPLAHASDEGLAFINADYTLYLGRLPAGDTIGLESGGHTSADGIAAGHCTMHDLTGPVGYVMTAAVANPVRPPRRPDPPGA